MPFVRISLISKKLSVEKQKISEAVHQALVREFNIPEDDYFHVFDELDKSQLFYPKSYLGIDHSDNLIYVHITAGTGRTFEQKQKLYAAIANNVATSTSVTINDVIIILHENGGKENWSFGNGKIQDLKHVNNLVTSLEGF